MWVSKASWGSQLKLTNNSKLLKLLGHHKCNSLLDSVILGKILIYRIDRIRAASTSNYRATTAQSNCTARENILSKFLNDLLVHDGTNNGLPRGVGFVEERVEVRQECVSDLQVMFGGRHQQRVWAECGWILGLETGREKIQIWLLSTGWKRDERMEERSCLNKGKNKSEGQLGK